MFIRLNKGLRRHRHKLLITLPVIVVLLLVLWAAKDVDKTAWDLIEILIIPAVLAIGAWWFNRQERKADRDNAIERQRQATLATYFDRMADLLLKDGLRKPKKGSEVRSVARARTLSVFRTLDGERKGQVLKFLYESALIISENPVIRLNKADLTMADLRRSNLDGINLEETYLYEAHLDSAKLLGAHMQGAQLNGAHLNKAWLNDADLLAASLNGASLNGAYLNRANLCMADLSEAKLEGAYLYKAGLDAAILTMSYLNGAHLKKAIVDPEVLLEARSLNNATLPDGTKYEEWIAKGKPDWTKGTVDKQDETEENDSES